MRIIGLTALLAFFSGCVSSTRNIPAVTGFDVNKYTGRWYEIARFPHSFERGLTRVTAEYSLNEDDSVSVLNRGYKPEKEAFQSAKARAVFSGPSDVGLLSVTFFWPFSGAYKIFHLDKENYKWALVTSNTTNYLWILARTPTLEKETLDALIKKAADTGFDTSRLVMVEQDAP